MKRAILTASIVFAVFIQVFSQQDAMFTQYMFNQLVINPAYAGNHDVINTNLLYRGQWVGIDGAPVTQTFSIDAPYKKKSVGLGLIAFNDKIGIYKKSGFYLNYSYKFKVKEGTLALGLQGGFSHIKVNYTTVKYSKFYNFGDVAFSQDVNQFTPNFGTGAFYNTSKLYAGFSIPYLLEKSLFTKTGIQGYRQFKTYLLTGGYVFDVNTDVKIKPSIMFKYVDKVPLQVDINVNVWFYNKFAFGLSYRTGDSFDALIEVQLNEQIRLGYAYDYTLTELNKFNYGSHELLIRYEFVNSKSTYLTPRYF